MYEAEPIYGSDGEMLREPTPLYPVCVTKVDDHTDHGNALEYGYEFAIELLDGDYIYMPNEQFALDFIAREGLILVPSEEFYNMQQGGVIY